MDIKRLWNGGTEEEWKEALAKYWERDTVKRLKDIETEIDNVYLPENIQAIRDMNGDEFYTFLHDKYYVWKFTDGRILASNRDRLESQEKDELLRIRDSIFTIYDSTPNDTELLLMNATRFKGLGVAGGSGLLSILFPEYFGTVDQFLVDSLCEISVTMGSEDEERICNISKENIKLEEGVYLERLLQQKAKELNERFETNEWTPRKIDMVLWSYRSNENA